MEIGERIPDDIRQAVDAIFDGVRSDESLADAIARALLAERERQSGADDPVTTVYGRLLWHHMDALRKGDEARREQAFQTAEALRAIWPAETQVWEDRYTRV